MTLRINDNGTNRDMTAAEIAYIEETQTQAQLEQTIAEQAASNRANAITSAKVKLAALGLTDNEIAALLGI